MLHSSLLFITLFTFLAQFLLVHLSLVIDDLCPLILRKHGGAIDPQVNKFFAFVSLRILRGENVSQGRAKSLILLHSTEVGRFIVVVLHQRRVHEALIQNQLFRCLLKSVRGLCVLGAAYCLQRR